MILKNKWKRKERKESLWEIRKANKKDRIKRNKKGEEYI